MNDLNFSDTATLTAPPRHVSCKNLGDGVYHLKCLDGKIVKNNGEGSPLGDTGELFSMCSGNLGAVSDEIGRSVAGIKDLKRLVLDLSEVKRIENEFIGQLLELKETLSSREPPAELIIVNPNRQPQQKFEVTGLKKHFTFATLVETAKDAILIPSVRGRE